MSQSDEALASQLETIIRERTQISAPRFLDAYHQLSRTRGKGCADAFGTLARLYAPRDAIGELREDIDRLLDGHPTLVIRQVKVFVGVAIGMAAIALAAKAMGATALEIVRITGVAGLALLVLFYLFKPLIEKTLLPKLGRESAEKLIHRLTIFVFVIALLAVACWGGPELIRAFKNTGVANPASQPGK